MKPMETPPTIPPHEPDFLLRVGAGESPARLLPAAGASLLLHGVALALLLAVRFDAPPPARPLLAQVRVHQVTPLVVPPDLRELTQKAPNQGKVSREFDLPSLMSPPVINAPPARAALSPKPRPALVAPPSLPAAPQIQSAEVNAAQLPPPGIGASLQPPPPQPPAEKPKLVFENVPGSGRGPGDVAGVRNPAIPVPKATVEEAVARVVEKPGGGLIVGDDTDLPGIGESLSRQPAPGRMGSSLELLSDPHGADFRPYLIRVLASVRRNWFAVIPESVRMGRQGRVVIQFAINRDGAVPKLVIAVPSGFDPMDRAAVAGISASNPFPPLPPEYRGNQIRLQLSFSYNMPR